MAPTLADIQTHLHDTQLSLASHVDKVRALEDVFAEPDTIKQEVGLLRQLVEKSSGRGSRDRAREREDGEFRGADMGSDDDDARSIRTIVPRGLERVEEEDEHQIARQEQQHHDEDNEGEERRRRRVELTRSRTPEPMELGMSHIPFEEDDEPRRWSSPMPSAVLDQLESAVALSSNLTRTRRCAEHDLCTGI
jgi:hypothetical protein